MLNGLLTYSGFLDQRIQTKLMKKGRPSDENPPCLAFIFRRRSLMFSLLTNSNRKEREEKRASIFKFFFFLVTGEEREGKGFFLILILSGFHKIQFETVSLSFYLLPLLISLFSFEFFCFFFSPRRRSERSRKKIYINSVGKLEGKRFNFFIWG